MVQSSRNCGGIGGEWSRDGAGPVTVGGRGGLAVGEIGPKVVCEPFV